MELGKELLSQGNSKCKGPEAEKSLALFEKNSQLGQSPERRGWRGRQTLRLAGLVEVILTPGAVESHFWAPPSEEGHHLNPVR